MLNLTDLKTNSLQLLESQKFAGTGSNTFENNQIRNSYVTTITLLFETLIRDENVENWTNLLVCLMEKRIALYTESFSKSMFGVTSTFGDALRAVHIALISHLTNLKTNDNTIATQVLTAGDTALNSHGRNYAANLVFMQLPDQVTRNDAKQSRIRTAALGHEEVLEWSSPKINLGQGGLFGAPAKFFAKTHPVLSDYPTALYSPNTQVDEWAGQISNPTPQVDTTLTSSNLTLHPKKLAADPFVKTLHPIIGNDNL